MTGTTIRIGWHTQKPQKRPRSRRRRKIIALLAEKHGWRCWLCGRAIDPELVRGNKWAATIDHVLPLAAGGTNAIGNLRLAHRRCNTTRGRKMLPEPKRKAAA